MHTLLSPLPFGFPVVFVHAGGANCAESCGVAGEETCQALLKRLLLLLLRSLSLWLCEAMHPPKRLQNVGGATKSALGARSMPPWPYAILRDIHGGYIL